MPPFFTILTPLGYFPVVFGMFIGAWACLEIILGSYGASLETAVPWISGEPTKLGPLLLLGVAIFGFVQSYVIRNRSRVKDDEYKPSLRPRGWLAWLSTISVLLALITTPYWLQVPVAEVWVAAIGVLTWGFWLKFFVKNK